MAAFEVFFGVTLSPLIILRTLKASNLEIHNELGWFLRYRTLMTIFNKHLPISHD